jgi:hypothetical protein
LNRTYTAAAPLDVLARAIMDEGYHLLGRDDVDHEFARLGKPSKLDPTVVIVIYRCGCIRAEGERWPRAAEMLAQLATGGAR